MDQLHGSISDETEHHIRNMTADELPVVIKDAIYKNDHELMRVQMSASRER